MLRQVSPSCFKLCFPTPLKLCKLLQAIQNLSLHCQSKWWVWYFLLLIINCRGRLFTAFIFRFKYLFFLIPPVWHQAMAWGHLKCCQLNIFNPSMRSHFSKAKPNNLQILRFSFLYCSVGSAEVELSNSFLSDEKILKSTNISKLDAWC